jgi:hypothetical protein
MDYFDLTLTSAGNIYDRADGEKARERMSLYFQDPFMDLMFLHTLTLHGFKGSDLGACYSADVEAFDVKSGSLPGAPSAA